MEHSTTLMEVQRTSTDMARDLASLHAATLTTATELKQKQEATTATLNQHTTAFDAMQQSMITMQAMMVNIQAHLQCQQPPAAQTGQPQTQPQMGQPQTQPLMGQPQAQAQMGQPLAHAQVGQPQTQAHELQTAVTPDEPPAQLNTDPIVITAPTENAAVPTELAIPEEPVASIPSTVFQFGVIRQPDGLPPAPPAAITTAAATAAAVIAVPDSGFVPGALQVPRRKPQSLGATMDMTTAAEKRRVLGRSPTDEDPTETKQRLKGTDADIDFSDANAPDATSTAQEHTQHKDATAPQG